MRPSFPVKEEEPTMTPSTAQPIRRIALGVGLFAAVWPAIFALDVFLPDTRAIDQFIGLAIHLLPNVILLLLVLLAWRQAVLGGLALLLVSLAPFVLLSNPVWVNALLGGPVFLSGSLFLLSAWQKKS